MNAAALAVRAALLLALCFEGAAAQRPVELTGRVFDAGGSPVEGASVELVEAGARTLSDGAGRYRFRAVSAGRYTLRVARVGYLSSSLPIELEGGRIRVLDVSLELAPLGLEALDVRVPAGVARGIRVSRSDVERSGARSAGDVLRGVPGVVVRSTSPGGPLTVSVRGSAPDAVLVLLDGVPINDPLTGEADLSSVSADAIESLELLPGAASGRYGARAQGGVIRIETRRESAGLEASAALGSLGARFASATLGMADPLAWGAGAHWSTLEGTFDFEIPDEAGGGSGRRENADARSAGAWSSVSSGLAGGSVRLRGTAEWVRRGLPGRSYAPARSSRQSVNRLQGTASWERPAGRASIRVDLAASGHQVRLSDAAPPFGLPYDDTARVSGLELRAEAGSQPAASGLTWTVGFEAKTQTVRTSVLSQDAPGRRADLGAFAQATRPFALGGETLLLSGGVRADRDPTPAWTLSRWLSLASSTWLGLETHVRLGSSYSPPTLADQYFRDEIGVEPNPELAAEHVPWELEVGVGRVLAYRGGRAELGVSAYRGDVRGMIVWAPDFRFVWSPRNVDVRRAGVESRGVFTAGNGRARLRASHSYTRVVYDRLPPDDDVQVVYRPRHSASVEAGWQTDTWLLDAGAHFTGVRYPVPARVNALPAFWTSTAAVSRRWRAGAWALTTALRADRLLGERESLIFGFPEPGRTLRLDVTLRQSPNSSDRATPR